MSIVSLLRDSRRENKVIDTFNDQQVHDLQQQADIIKYKLGKQPDSWQEFKAKNESTLARPRRGALVGGLIGAVVGFSVVALVALALGPASVGGVMIAKLGAQGAVVGGLISWDREITRENDANTKRVNNYKAYLDGYEESRGHMQEKAAEAQVEYHDDHAKKLQESSDQTKVPGR